MISSVKKAQHEYNRNYYLTHKEEIIKRKKDRKLANPEKIREQDRRSYLKFREKPIAIRAKNTRKLRQEVILSLGGKCKKCNFFDWRALQIDHKEGEGREDRKRFTNQFAYWRYVIQNPIKYQLLCANCNWIKRYENEENRKRKL